MAGALLQSTNIPSSFAYQRNGQFQRSGKGKSSVKIMASLTAMRYRTQSFRGLHVGNALGTLGSSNGCLFTKMNSHLSVRRRKASRGVVKVRAMFERFTEKAIKVIMLAQEEARRLGHNFVGTEQILLGLIGEGTGIAAKVLKSMGINLKDARVEVEKIIGRGSGFVAVEIPFTPRAKRVLELSLEEARQLGKLM